MQMENNLYAGFASYYATMSNDRNFSGQLEFILNSYEEDHPCRSLLELFAGQSLHGIAAQEKEGIDVWAVDSSSEMKRLALEHGFKEADQYIVGNLPEAILHCDQEVQFDCITCLYHGLSNLNIRSVYELLYYSKNLLSKNGKVFLEIHNIQGIMEYLSAPSVQTITDQAANGDLMEYAWPSGKIRWNPYNYKAEVPIKLIISEANGSQQTTELLSEDYIYSAEEIIFLAGLLGYESKILAAETGGRESFGNSVVIELSQQL